MCGGKSQPFWMKRAWEVNFCRTFISSISLPSELLGSNLTQILLNPSKVISQRLFLLNRSVVFVNAENVAFRIESFS